MRKKILLVLCLGIAACSSPTEAPPPDVSPLIEEGWDLYEAGEFEAARARFEAALAAHPASAPAHSGRGFALARLRFFAPAAEAFGRAIELSRGAPDPFAGRALVEAARNEYREVIDPATRLLLLAPNYQHLRDPRIDARAVRLVRAQAYYHAGEFAGAAADLDLLDPANAPHSTDPQALLAALAALAGFGS
jgi:tetratricopeptide (TPR) repeat protein